MTFAARPRPGAGRVIAALTRIDRAAEGLAGDVALYGFAAAFAAVTALTSSLLPHRGWGAIAAWAYLVAFAVAGGQLIRQRASARRPETTSTRRPDVTGWRAVVCVGAWLGATLVPLVVEAVQRASGRVDRAQEEVVVVEHAGARLLDAGTPYLGRDAIAALPADERLLGYLPYQPGMALFGMPRAIAGNAWYTDARVWFALVTAAAIGAAALLLRKWDRPALVRAVQFATVLPICALTLATGGDDLPVLALCLLALACCATGRFGAAGVAVGAAASLKLFALPVLAVLAALALVSGRGPRLLAGGLGLPVLTLLPALLVDRDAAVENVLRFPLGHGVVSSPAQSPFPGELISAALPGGRYVAAALLVAAAVAIAVVLLRRPPRTAASAAWISGYGLLAAILLMPTTRFGYLLYPLALCGWIPALRSPADVPAGARVPAPFVVAPAGRSPR